MATTTTKKNLYNRLYDNLNKIGVLDVKEYAKFKAPGFMDLNIDVLSETTTTKVIAMAHNYVQNGDLMADPDMEIRINKVDQTAEALTFQQDGVGLYQRVYDAQGRLTSPGVKMALNNFLDVWTHNLIEQGHRGE